MKRNRGTVRGREGYVCGSCGRKSETTGECCGARMRTKRDLEKIRKTAYDIYVKEGGAPNRDLDHWLAAERIVETAQ